MKPRWCDGGAAGALAMLGMAALSATTASASHLKVRVNCFSAWTLACSRRPCMYSCHDRCPVGRRAVLRSGFAQWVRVVESRSPAFFRSQNLPSLRQTILLLVCAHVEGKSLQRRGKIPTILPDSFAGSCDAPVAYTRKVRSGLKLHTRT